MTKYVNQLFLIVALLIVGCSDPCDDAACGPGMCDDGTCICPDGYEGSSCETLENNKYFGVFNTTASECGTTNDIFLTSINLSAKSGGSPFDVLITFSADDTFTLEGTLTDDKITASGVVNGFDTTFNGDFVSTDTINGDLEVVDYSLCSVTLVK